MTEDEGKLNHFLNLMLKLTEEQKEIISDFDVRIESFYKHKHLKRKIIKSWRKFKKANKSSERREAREEILKDIKNIRDHIFPQFNNFLRGQIEDDELELLSKKKRVISEAEKIEFDDYKKIKEELRKGVLHGDTRKKLLKQLENIKWEIKEEEKRKESYNTYFNKILQEFEKIKEKEKTFIKEEYDALNKLALQITIEGIHIRETNKTLFSFEEAYEGLRKALIIEKENVVDPINKFLKKERDVFNKIKTYEKKGLITKKDITDAVSSFTTTQEVQRYQSLLLKLHDKLSSGAKRMSPKIGVISAHVGKKERFSLKALTRLALFDTLTGATSRLVFMRDINKLINKISPSKGRRKEHRKIKKGVFSLISFDIDNFKDFNDTYGHKMGDNVLVFVVKTIKSRLRGVGTFARMGGEEFMILLPDMHKNQADKIANRLREGIQEKSASSKTIPGEIKISVGVAEFPKDAIAIQSVEEKFSDKDAIMHAADIAMYVAKEEGKNRVIKFAPQYSKIKPK